MRRLPSVLLFALVFLVAPLALADESDRGTKPPGGNASPDRASANGLSLVGNVGYSYVYTGNTGTLRLTADEVRNSRGAGTTSGTLQLQFWATTTAPVFGQTINAYTMGVYTMGTLNGGFSFFNVDSGLVAFTPPPAGTYYVTLALMEYDSSQGGYIYQDFFTFSQLKTFSGPTACIPTSTSLCLNNNRFRVTATWQTTTGSGVGTAVSLTSDTGYFWFFSANNVEMVVKVVNGCGFNSRYWVFGGGLTNVYVSLQVTDTLTGQVRFYTNPINTAYLPLQDTSAFATCP